METNGDFRKYFDALNKRLEKEFQAIDRRFEAIDKRFEAIDKRFDGIDKRLDAIEGTLKAQGVSILSMHDSLAVLVKAATFNTTQIKELNARVAKLEKNVERLDIGQTELIKIVTEIRGLESGKKLELKEVRYDEVEKTLTGTIREKHVKYGRKKK